MQYEKLRRRNLLTYVDSVRDDFFPRSLTIFASHQWLGRDDPADVIDGRHRAELREPAPGDDAAAK